jgi:Sec-independent protein translocase protein TatA
MNFLGMGSLEILTIFIIAFLILGPTKMIGMGKEIGKFVRDARKMGSELQNSITEGNEKPIKSLRSLAELDEVADDDLENPTSLLTESNTSKSADKNEKDESFGKS